MLPLSRTHPNVIGVLELGELFLVLELLEGDTLESRLARERLAPEALPRALRPAAQLIARA